MDYKFDFSVYEQKKNDELEVLMKNWISQVSTKNKNTIDNGNKTKRSPKRCFAKDGFFPGYFDEKNLRILFVGREPRKIGGYDFRDTTKECFDETCIGKNNWWRRIFYIVYGIRNKGHFSFEDIPTAQEILNKMYEKNDYGFACINISKYSNDHPKYWQANTKLVSQFFEDSELEKTNFFKKELEFLNPDVMITANLWDWEIDEHFIDLCLPNENFSKTSSVTHNREKVAEYGKYNLNGHEIDFIDLFHFSASDKKDKYHYYNPVMKVLFPKIK